MKAVAAVLAFLMLLLSPVLRALDKTEPPEAEGYLEFPDPEKTKRAFLSPEVGEHDLVLHAGDSLAGAVKTVEALRKGGEEAPVTVWLHEGTYAVGDALLPEGTKNLTFAAWENERVVFTEGLEIKNFRETEVNGARAFVADAPETADFFTLYRGETPLSLTRFPESGYLTVRAPDRETALFTDENTPWEYCYGDLAFFHGDDLTQTSFKNLADVRIKLMHYWFCENTSLTFLDGERVGMKKPCSMRIREGDRYFFENVFEMLKTPGQWYLDREARRLYYVPGPGETPEETVLFAPTREVLLTLKNAENVAFHNIRFVGADYRDPVPDADVSWLGAYGMLHPQGNLEVKGAAEIEGSRFLSFVNCDFLNLGGTGVRFTGKNTDCKITGCRFENVGCNAVFIGGANAAEEENRTRRIDVTDCLIEGYGRNVPSGIGVLLTYAADCELSHNEVHNGCYTAFSVGWVWGYGFHATDGIRICNNLIYDVGQGWLSDMGGIYTLGAQPHTVLSGNVIRNVAADPGEGGYGGWGIYLDEGSGGITVENNLVYDCGSQSFHQHYGEKNVVRNNIFAFGGEGQVRSSRTEDHKEFDLTGNVLVGEDRPLWIYAERKRFTEGGNLFWDYENGKRVFGTVDTDVDKKLARAYPLSMRLFGWLKTDLIADPLFRDPEKRDFTPATNSPAIEKLGFVPFNFKEAGTKSLF